MIMCRIFFFLVFFLLVTSIFCFEKPAACEENDLSSIKVVARYELIIDKDVDEVIRELREAGVQLIFREYIRWGVIDPNVFSIVKDYNTRIKEEIPYIHITGGITAAIFYVNDYWPNGTIVDHNQYNDLLFLYDDEPVPHYANPEISYVMDISKPLARDFIVEWAKLSIDSGIDSIFVDEVEMVPRKIWEFDQKNRYKEYYPYWKDIVDRLKEYAAQEHGIELLVSMNDLWVHPRGSKRKVMDPWPHQDFISISFSLKTFELKKPVCDWEGYKKQVKKVYGKLIPIIAFIDDGVPPTPHSFFGNMPLEDQEKMLKMLHEEALEHGLLFAYPLHGGVINNYLEPPYEPIVYDAKQMGTFEAIKSLTNTLVKVFIITETTTEVSHRYQIKYISLTITTSRITTVRIGQSLSLSIMILSAAIIIAAIYLKKYK